MKNFLSLAFLMVLSCNVIAADSTSEKNKVKPQVDNVVKTPEPVVKTSTVCIRGKLFAIATTSTGGISIVQILKGGPNHLHPQPMEC